MSESTISLVLFSIIPGVLVTIAVGGFMVFTGTAKKNTYKKYSKIVEIISATICLIVLIIGISFKFYTVSNSINLNWVFSGGIGLVMIVSMMFD